jgi:hypothetical protein
VGQTSAKDCKCLFEKKYTKGTKYSFGKRTLGDYIQIWLTHINRMCNSTQSEDLFFRPDLNDTKTETDLAFICGRKKYEKMDVTTCGTVARRE